MILVNKEYAEEYAHVRKQYLPKSKTKRRKDIEVIVKYCQELLIIKLNINSHLCRYLTHPGHKNNI